MVIPINKQGGRATYYYPGDGYLRRYDDFGVTQSVLRFSGSLSPTSWGRANRSCLQPEARIAKRASTPPVASGEPP